MARKNGMTLPERVGDAAEINYGAPPAPDFGPLARDRIPVRSMVEDDLRRVIDIDRRITGWDRTEYFTRKLDEVLKETDLHISLAAELDGVLVGFIMARVDLGEFGQVDTTAVIDTIGVDPEYGNRGVGRALLSQLLANLGTLRVDRVRTEVDWLDRDLLAYLDHCGFVPSAQLCFERPIA